MGLGYRKKSPERCADEMEVLYRLGYREVVLAAVRYNGLALMHAAEDLKADREIVLEAVQDFASALEYASDDLKNDRDIVLEAVKQYSGALEYASEALQQDEELKKYLE